MKKRVSILGATGSIGTSTLKVIEAFPEMFEIVLMTANRSRDALLHQALHFKPKAVAIGNAKDAEFLRKRLPSNTTVVSSDELLPLIAATKADVTISGMVGAAGLKPTMAAIRAGSNIGLANKEAMVVAGELMNAASREAGVEILPVDSEHNALHQCLRGEKRDEVRRLVLTASGGPFRTFEGDFSQITVKQALDHPTWSMGPKITIDSASMMNKGLEVIEAHHLFGFDGRDIDIVVHPQSIVHSMIETIDGSYKAQLSKTDMCDPIQYALTWPDRCATPFDRLDITKGLTLEFFPADRERFPCIQLAYDAMDAGQAAACALNAANEIAVAAFLEEKCRFTEIPMINRACMDAFGHRSIHNLDDLIELDHESRLFANKQVGGGSS